MTRNWLLSALIFSVALNLGVLGAWAYFSLPGPSPSPPLPPGPRGWSPPGLGALLHELNLEPEQKAQLQEYFRQRRPEMLALRRRLNQCRNNLLNLLKADAPDDAAISAQVQEIVALQGQLEHHMAQALVAALKVLKPEQKQVLLDRLCRRFCRLPGEGHHGPAWRLRD